VTDIYRSWLKLIEAKRYLEAARLAAVERPDLFNHVKTLDEIRRLAS